MFEPFGVLVLALKTSLVIGTVGVASLVFVKKAAAFRHLLWMSALVFCLTVPLAISSLPSLLQIPVPWQTVQPVKSPAQNIGAQSASGISPASANVETGKDRMPASVATWLALVWLTGAIVVVARRIVSHIALNRRARATPQLRSRRWLQTLNDAMREQGMSRALRVLESGTVVSPCVWGFYRPVLLLPAAGDDWSENERRHALLHELAHIRRHDYLSDVIASLACAMHWYNPFVWFAAREARSLAEQACDDAVLRGGETPSNYAKFLLDIASQSTDERDFSSATFGMARRSEIYSRIAAILDRCRTRTPVEPRSLILSLVSLLGLTLAIATTTTVAAGLAVQTLPVGSAATHAASAAHPALPRVRTRSRQLTVAPASRTTRNHPAIPAIAAVPAIPAIPAIPANPAATPTESNQE